MTDIVAEALLKQAQDLVARTTPYDQWQTSKGVAIDTLVSKDIGMDKAASMLSDIEGDTYPNLGLESAHAAELAEIGKVLEKTASYIEELRVKLDSKEAELTSLEKAAEEAVKSEAVGALQESGRFSETDIDSLKGLDENVLEKLASHVDVDPASMGGPSDRINTTADPLMQFCLS